ncbi:MAG: transglycosylase domain-containing protein, partial [Gemmatimonadales bacterium]
MTRPKLQARLHRGRVRVRAWRKVTRRWLAVPANQRHLVAGVAGAAALVFGITLASWMLACADGRCRVDPDVLAEVSLNERSVLLAADGRAFARLGIEARQVVPLEQISPAMQAAIVATEDRRFFHHNGVDYPRIIGAFWNNLIALRYAEGFSTITMQLARNLWPDRMGRSERSLARKIREMQVAWELEDYLTKARILELYLNQIPLGGRMFGVESAAREFFGKPANELDVAEAAVIAALPKAPATYNPREHPARALERRNLVIELMGRSGYLLPADVKKWQARPLGLAPAGSPTDPAPYFVEHVRRIVQERFGSRVYNSGLRIYTTLDLDLQERAEQELEAQLQAVEAGKYGRYNRPSYEEVMENLSPDDQSNRSGYLQGLVVTVDAERGYIRAMVGGRDFSHNRFNRVTQAMRQPGSAFKPFVYAAALRRGASLSRVVVDSEVAITEVKEGEPAWTPTNYDGTYSGTATLREGLYLSINTVTVRIGMDIGPRAVVEEARRFGITTPIPPYPSIFLGTAEVIPLELVAAYTAFATGGVRSVPMAILRVEDREGNVLWEPAIERHQVMDKAHAWLMNEALRDVVRRGTAFSAITGQGFYLPAGGKTGTTDD